MLPTVLIVDRDLILQQMLVQKLEKHGFNVLAAANGKQAEKLCKGFVVDVALIELILPVQDGFETIMMLRYFFPHMKLIAMTCGGKTPPHLYLQTAEHFGANKSLLKPFTYNQVIDNIEDALGRSLGPSTPGPFRSER